MEKRETYYLYSLFIINIVATLFLTFNLHNLVLVLETIALLVLVIASVYLIYLFEVKNSNSFLGSLVLFAFSTINALMIYVILNKIDALFLALLNVFGIFLTTHIIPSKNDAVLKNNSKPLFSGIKKNYEDKDKGKNKAVFEKGLNPLKEMPVVRKGSNAEKRDYLIEELERELSKSDKKNNGLKQDFVKRDNFELNKEKNDYDELNAADESEIIIEEIKPTVEKDLHPLNSKKSQPHKVSKSEILKFVSDLQKAEEEEYDELTKNDPEIIEELKPTIEKDVHKKKKSKKHVSKVSRNNVEKFIKDFKKAEDAEYDKLTANEPEVIEELKPITEKEPSLKSKPRIDKVPSLKEIDKLMNELRRAEDEDYDKKTLDEIEVIEELKPIENIPGLRNKILKKAKKILKSKFKKNNSKKSDN